MFSGAADRRTHFRRKRADGSAADYAQLRGWIHEFRRGPDRGEQNVHHERTKVHTGIAFFPRCREYPDENEVYMPTTACQVRSLRRPSANRQARMVQFSGGGSPALSASQAQADLSGFAAKLQKAYRRLYEEKIIRETTALEERCAQNAGRRLLGCWRQQALMLIRCCETSRT